MLPIVGVLFEVQPVLILINLICVNPDRVTERNAPERTQIIGVRVEAKLPLETVQPSPVATSTVKKNTKYRISILSGVSAKTGTRVKIIIRPTAYRTMDLQIAEYRQRKRRSRVFSTCVSAATTSDKVFFFLINAA